MKATSLVSVLAASALLVRLGTVATHADGMGTAFTCQGKLSIGTNAFTGMCDFQFSLVFVERVPLGNRFYRLHKP